MIHIRLARPGERAALEDLQRRASLALDAYREQLLANPDAIHLPPEQIALGQVSIAELDGRVAGFAAVIMSEQAAELDGLFVEPDHWGEGIGRALADHAVHEARKKGLTLSVVASPTALGFYEKCGFSVEGEAETRFGPAIRMSR
jgi:N-acetylglutamate synthase-like GNAT family acetyltransferase